MYKKIFTKGKINGCEIKNRIILAPMDDSLGTATGEISPRAIEYYAAKAKGGCGLVIVGYVAVCGSELSGIAITGQAHLRTLADRHAMGNLAERIHEYGGKVFVQLNHPGRKTTAKYNDGNEPVSCSAMTPQMEGRFAPARELTTDEIHQLVDYYAIAAEHAFLAGIDGIEIHCAHSYLLSQFMSPAKNARMDEYGGSMENRCRIVVEIIQAIRKKVPPRYPVTVRLNAFDGENLEGENTLEDTVQIAKYLEDNGVDAIHFTLGTVDRAGAPEMEAGWRNEFYKRFKQELHVPMYGPNEVKTPEEGEKILEEGVYDFLVMGRQQSADPQWGNKAREGRPQDIRPCISCNYCLYHVTAEESQIRCAVNPTLGREIDNLLPMAQGDGMIVVIGAGPAGIQAALTAADRGFKVIMIDKNGQIGGALQLANKPPKKFRIDNLINYYATQIKEHENIELRLNTEVTSEMLDELEKINPYAVILASGGKPIIPRVAGVEKGVTANDVLSGKVVLKNKRVIVVGGGMTGLETAALLCGDNDVTVLEMMPMVGNGIFINNVIKSIEHLSKNGTKLKTSTSLKEIKDGAVVVEPFAGTGNNSVLTGIKNIVGYDPFASDEEKPEGPYEIPCDTVVLSIGVFSENSLLPELEARFEQVVNIGDSAKPGKITTATSDGYYAAKNI